MRQRLLTAEERRVLALKAVNRLIADVEARRLLSNKELGEAIVACIRESGGQQLRKLERLLSQQELERADLQDEVRNRPV